MTPVLAPRARPDRSFERLYQRYVGDVYRYALAVMRNEADAEDVAQTTFMNAYRAFQRGERPEKPQNWLIAIAHNVCRQRFRQSARRPSEVSFEDDIADRLVDDDDAPTGEDIRRALGHLAFNQRAALVMRELEGRSYAEIAEILDLSTSAVETLIFRARRALREQLETALTCGEAELAISRQLDGRLSRKEKGALRAHLRQCAECSSFARRQRAQRSALRSLAAVPLPASLSSFFGGGSAAVGTALATKAAVGITVAAIVGGGTYEGIRHAGSRRETRATDASTPVFRDAASDARSVPAPREHLPAPRRDTIVRPSPRGHGHASRAAARPNRGHGRAEGVASHSHGVARSKGHGHGKPSYRGDASIAARHVRTHPAHAHRAAATAHPAHAQGAAAASHPTRPAHPTRPVHSTRPVHPAAPAPAPKSHPPKPSQAPGPYDAGPPHAGGNGGGSGGDNGGGNGKSGK
jgi:RNA polymerase sigma factor (sigma-70 family)